MCGSGVINQVNNSGTYDGVFSMLGGNRSVRYGFYFVSILMMNILVNRMGYVQDRQYQHLFYLHKQKGGVFIP